MVPLALITQTSAKAQTQYLMILLQSAAVAVVAAEQGKAAMADRVAVTDATIRPLAEPAARAGTVALAQPEPAAAPVPVEVAGIRKMAQQAPPASAVMVVLVLVQH
jgi:hypothetical protein